MMNEEEVIESFSALGQDHLFDCWTDWDEHKKSILLEELASLDLKLLSSLQKCLPEKEVPSSLSPVRYLSHEDIIKMDKERELLENLFKHISEPSKEWPQVTVGRKIKNEVTWTTGGVDDEFRDYLIGIEKHLKETTLFGR